MNKVMNSIGVKSKRASEKKIDLDTKNKVLKFYAELLDKENKSILRENSKDIKFAKKKGIKENLINRLRIDEVKLKNIKKYIRKSTQIHENLSKSKKIYGNTRKSTKINENAQIYVRKYMKIYENIRNSTKYTKIYEHQQKHIKKMAVAAATATFSREQ